MFSYHFSTIVDILVYTYTIFFISCLRMFKKYIEMLRNKKNRAECSSFNAKFTVEILTQLTKSFNDCLNHFSLKVKPRLT